MVWRVGWDINGQYAEVGMRRSASLELLFEYERRPVVRVPLRSMFSPLINHVGEVAYAARRFSIAFQSGLIFNVEAGKGVLFL